MSKDGHAALSEVLAGTVPVKEAPWFDSKHRIYELFQYRGMKHTAKVLDSGRLEKALDLIQQRLPALTGEERERETQRAFALTQQLLDLK